MWHGWDNLVAIKDDALFSSSAGSTVEIAYWNQLNVKEDKEIIVTSSLPNLKLCHPRQTVPPCDRHRSQVVVAPINGLSLKQLLHGQVMLRFGREQIILDSELHLWYLVESVATITYAENHSWKQYWKLGDASQQGSQLFRASCYKWHCFGGRLPIFNCVW